MMRTKLDRRGNLPAKLSLTDIGVPAAANGRLADACQQRTYLHKAQRRELAAVRRSLCGSACSINKGAITNATH
jgi:hypothetical protein